jgi:hypothetical protein
MHVQRRQDVVIVLVLHVGQLVAQHAHVMIVNQSHGAHHFQVRLLRRGLDQFLPDQVAKGFGAVGVSASGDQVVKLFQKIGINGYAIAASDGRLGTVSDFLFDDASWLVRWLVVDTGNWLSGRKVLLPPSVLGQLDAKEHEFSVNLTMQQVKDSPDIDTQRPVSRQMETSVYDYYGWSPYWGTGFYMGGYGYMPGAGMASPYLGSRRRDEEIADARRRDDDPHLRSIEAVTGYHIHASDGEVGHVEEHVRRAP